MNRDEVDAQTRIGIDLRDEVCGPSHTGGVGLGTGGADLNCRVVEGRPKRDGCRHGYVGLREVVGLIETEHRPIAFAHHRANRTGDPR